MPIPYTRHKTLKRGTHRCASPLETFEKISKVLPLFGITRVANITGLDNVGIPVVMVVRPNSRSLSVSQGKGRDLISAKVSGLMESIETFHAERIFRNSLLLSYEDMFYQYHATDLDKISRSNQAELKENTKILWCQGTDLLGDKDIWVPHALVHMDFTYPTTPDHQYFISDSNGLASGNSHLEAIIHGLCEVIERDAVALWCATPKDQQEKYRIDPMTIDDPGCTYFIDHLHMAGIQYAFWEITTDIGIPTYICKIIPDNDFQRAIIRPSYGSGTHPNKHVALSKAITEAVQSRLTFISGSRDDQGKERYQEYFSTDVINEWLKELEIPNQMKDFGSCITYENESLEEDYDLLLARLEDVGIEQIACVDLMRENIQIPVVKVIVPGLENISSAENRIYGQRMKRLLDSQNIQHVH